MGFLDRLLGRTHDERTYHGVPGRPDDVRPYAGEAPGKHGYAPYPGQQPAGRPGGGVPAAHRDPDEVAVERYRYLLRTAPPETIEAAHHEAFARLTEEQRAVRAFVPQPEPKDAVDLKAPKGGWDQAQAASSR